MTSRAAWLCERCAGQIGAPWAGYIAKGLCGDCRSANTAIRWLVDLPNKKAETMAAPIVHSEYGASISNRIKNCAGCVNLARRCPKPPSSKAADEGTRLHALTDLCIKNGELDANAYAGLRLEGEPADRPVLTEEQCERVNVSLAHFWPLALQPGAIHWAEQHFDLSHIRPGVFGTNDAAVLLPDGTLHTMDWKYGRGHAVEVEDNYQPLCYASGAVNSLMAKGYDAPSSVVLTIVQPLCPHADGAVRSWTIDLLTLAEFEGSYGAAIDATNDPDAKRTPGDHCLFCPGTYIGENGRLQCDEYAAQTNAAADAAFAVLNDPPALAAMDAAEIGRRYSELALLERYVKEFKAFVRRRALVEVPAGLAWAPGKSWQKWNLEGADVISLTRSMFGDKEADAISEVVSPAKAKKALGPAAFATLAGMVDKGNYAPQLAKKGSRKTELSLADVNAFFAKNSDDLFADLDE